MILSYGMAHHYRDMQLNLLMVAEAEKETLENVILKSLTNEKRVI